MNKYLFITGMGRSGTTLLDKILSNHPHINILSQPLPLLHTELSKRFIKQKYDEDLYYALNKDYDNNYKIDFNNFLKNNIISNSFLDNVFLKMKGYSGQYTSFDKVNLINTNNTFIDIYKKTIKQLTRNGDNIYIGSKEIFCESFIPFFTDNNIKCIGIIRDPRDIIASVNYPKKEKFLGAKKPTLFLVRSWLKSFNYFKSIYSENFIFLKYEDLIKNTEKTLSEITTYLNLTKFNTDFHKTNLKDQNGKEWSSNTSNEKSTSNISSESIGTYKMKLPKKEIEYIEALCYDQLKELGYQVGKKPDQKKIILEFKDFGIKDSHEIKYNFSSDEKNIKEELKRLKL
ncbi:sulfotransferase [Flammeovirga sp. MY04]|uniref:sulfotransferase n=1 Tax=Flammeovirga sp. MY04 TaxID=1191459 RepID=UPI00082541D6|nr:sulfotransferase [Flammeovirga sp. MY04]ANQ50222.2 sulfotransferase [Flammeovirga sp. MY04]